GVLPLDPEKKIAVLGFSNGFDGWSTMASLVSGLRANGLRFESAYLQENSTAEQAEAAKKAASEADVLVVGLYGRVRSGAKNSVGIPENGAAILREALASGKTVIGISFGNPYILKDFPEMKTYIVAYGDMSTLQHATAKAITGRIEFSGKLPISLPGFYPRGTGLSINFPKALLLPEPPYPAAAQAMRIGGDVLVNATLKEDGSVDFASALTGHPLLRRSALVAARGSRFQMTNQETRRVTLVYRFVPYEKNGTEVPCCENSPYLISIVSRPLVVDTYESS